MILPEEYYDQNKAKIFLEHLIKILNLIVILIEDISYLKQDVNKIKGLIKQMEELNEIE